MNPRYESYDVVTGRTCGHLHLRISKAVGCAYECGWESPAVRKTVGGEPTVMTDEEYRDADAEIAKLSERLAHISEKEMGQ